MAFALVFLRRNNYVLGHSVGHVGWGFELADGRFCCGATENVTGAIAGSWPEFDNNAWYRIVADFPAMLAEMQQNHFAPDNRYTEYKMLDLAGLRPAHPEAALATAQRMPTLGYKFPGNTCLDHACKVLERYGLPFHELGGSPAWGMPWLQTHPAPNDWFDAWPANGGLFHL